MSAPPPPAVAAEVFGEQLGLARDFADRLAGAGIERGLLGPREVPRLWERHLLNCAVLTDLLPPDARVVDVGSGAGLPGIALAVRGPALRVDLVEPLQRRVVFLEEVVAALGLTGRVRVIRGRAEEQAVLRAVGQSDWVTARAVAPLDRLVRWCLPLLRTGGCLLAMKGEGAAAEVQAHTADLQRAGATELRIVRCGQPPLKEPVTVVVCRRGASAATRERVG